MSSIFTLIPRPLYEFAGLDMTTRYAFGLIYDRLQLSAMLGNRERFTDGWGLYCVFSREAMAAEMGVTVPTLRKAITKLIERGLIKARISKKGDCWRYYMRQKAKDSIAMQELPDYLPYVPTEGANPIVDP